MYKKISFFNGLNALRFIAAYLVVLHHTETIRVKEKIYEIPKLSLFQNGGTGVFFFFVLSGFLITYLLLKEYHESSAIRIKNFYMRRILRIWPLYYLLVVIGLFIIPFILSSINYPYELPYTIGQALPLYAFFLPYLVVIIYGASLLSPLWSIGVEEMFYAFWAPIVHFFRANLKNILWGIVIVKSLIMGILYFTVPQSFIFQLLSLLSFEHMAIGGIGAMYIFNKNSGIESSVFFSIPAQWILLLVIVLEIGAHHFLCHHVFIWNVIFDTPVVSEVIRAFLFCWLIINVSVNKKSIIKLKNRFLDYLGQISYGIYMYHMSVLFVTVFIVKKIGIQLPNPMVILLFNALVLAGTVVISGLSKRFFEDKFMKLRYRFQPGSK